MAGYSKSFPLWKQSGPANGGRKKKKKILGDSDYGYWLAFFSVSKIK